MGWAHRSWCYLLEGVWPDGVHAAGREPTRYWTTTAAASGCGFPSTDSSENWWTMTIMRVAANRASCAVKGPQVMLGYWQRPDATAEIIKTAGCITGDIAVMDDEGFLCASSDQKI